MSEPLVMAATLKRPRAILFDWDNTLVDSWGDDPRRAQLPDGGDGRSRCGRSSRHRERVRLSLRESFPAHFGERWEEARKIYLDRFRAIHLERLTAAAGREPTCCGDLAGAGHLPRRRQQQDRRAVAPRGAIISAGRRCSARLSAPATRRTDKPHCDPVASGACSQRHRRPAPRSGLSATPRSTWNARSPRGCIPVLLGDPDRANDRIRSLPAAPHGSPMRQACFAHCGPCDRRHRAHIFVAETTAAAGWLRFAPEPPRHGSKNRMGDYPCRRKNRRTFRTCS